MMMYFWIQKQARNSSNADLLKSRWGGGLESRAGAESWAVGWKKTGKHKVKQEDHREIMNLGHR